MADDPEIEIPDPTPGGGPPPEEPAAGTGPYRNLMVPLVVVPAMIVMVLVLIFVLFGAVAGDEDSPRENLDRLLNGGFNERQQAAFNLVRQVLEHDRALSTGETPEWDIDASFLPDLRSARDSVGELEAPRDVPIPLVLSSVLAKLGDPAGVEQLAEMTRLSDALDPEGQYRLYAAVTLGQVGAGLAAGERRLATETLVGLLDSEDPGLVLVATAGLQNLPSEASTAALREMLGSRALELRGTAALSLAALGDPAGADVLRDMLAIEVYAAEREAAPAKWPPRRVSESRTKALEALVGLGLAPPRAELERLADDDVDPNVRAAARKLFETL